MAQNIDPQRELTIKLTDINEEVCQRCGKCCEIELKTENTDSRYRMFLRRIGFNVQPPPAEGKEDCCEKAHPVRVLFGPCVHLRKTEENGKTLYKCAIYETRPQLCRDYNCVAWALHTNEYNRNNAMLCAAEKAWKEYREELGL